MDVRDQIAACVWHCCLSCWTDFLKFGARGHGALTAEKEILQVAVLWENINMGFLHKQGCCE